MRGRVRQGTTADQQHVYHGGGGEDQRLTSLFHSIQYMHGQQEQGMVSDQQHVYSGGGGDQAESVEDEWAYIERHMFQQEDPIA